jgi:hypothetical protein
MVGIAAWVVIVSVGMVGVWRYKLTPKAPGEAPASWPKGSIIPQAPGEATLIMLAHPKCSCTRASLSELSRLMADVHGRATAHVLFVKPDGVPAGWEATDTFRSAAAIPGVVVHVDDDGAEARRFGATVSGYVLAYNTDGTLIFHGGITGARGHEGDNAGRQRLTALLTAGIADRRDSPTFGCDLDSAESARSDRAN